MNAPAQFAQTAQWADLADTTLCSRITGFVEERGASVFHLPAWLHAVERGTGQRAGGIVTQHLGEITGWLPLTQVRSLLFGNAVVSSGFGVGGGILADTDCAAHALAKAASEYASRYGFGSIELRGGPIPSGWAKWDDRHCGFERALEQDEEAQLLSIPRKARAEVRKALASSLTYRIGRSVDDLDVHYAAYSESVRNLGTPVFPKRLFQAMLDAFPDTSDILTILTDDGVPLASVFSFYHNGSVMPFWGGGGFAARGARANDLMYFRLMLHARERGMERFDFGRSKTGSGPYRFKKNWGFDPQPLTYGLWNARGQKARNIDPTSGDYSRKIELWKRLPLPIANRIGPLIARDLA